MKSKKQNVPNQKHTVKEISTVADVDVPVELYDEDSSVDGSDNDHELVEVEASRPNKASYLPHAPFDRPEPRQGQDTVEIDEQGSSTSRAEMDAASGLYKQMCDLRQKVSRLL